MDADYASAANRKLEINATLASCCGFLGEVTLTDSAVIILFAGMLGAGDMFTMMTTSFLPLFNGLCIIPMAAIAARIGAQKIIMYSCTFAAVAYFLAGAAPFCGPFAAIFLITTIALFSLCLTGFIAGWFPLLDSFLSPKRRAPFLSRMRFCHQLTATIFLFIVSGVIGNTPSLWMLQIIIFIGALIFTGRIFFVGKIHITNSDHHPCRRHFHQELRRAIDNKPLLCFSLYLFILNMAAYGTVPLTMIFLKQHLRAPDNIIVLLSALALSGMIFGYFTGGGITAKLKVKGSLLLFHAIFALANFILFFINHGGTAVYCLIGSVLFIYNFAVAGCSIVSSSEMMAMAAPGNKTMDMALCGAFYYGGFGVSRLATSIMLGCGMFAAQWGLGGIELCRYQTFFILYSFAVIFAAVFLLIVPAVFPRIDDVPGPPLN